MSDSHNLDFLGRRELLKLGAAGLGLGATSGLSSTPASADLDHQQQRPDMGPAPAKLFAADPIDVVRIGFVGVGGMGGAHVRNFLGLEGVEIVALCDIDSARNEEVSSWVTDDGRAPPTMYGRHETDFVRMCETEDQILCSLLHRGNGMCQCAYLRWKTKSMLLPRSRPHTRPMTVGNLSSMLKNTASTAL